MANPSDLETLNQKYDPDYHLVWGKVSDNGIHTRFKPGSSAHPIREDFRYVNVLLDDGSPSSLARAEEVLAAALSYQSVDPTAATFGIWPWLAEESVEKMNPPDWNWADFCGAQLVMTLAHHADKLSPTLLQATRRALHAAAWCIFRRNVTSEYTNIAVMGGGVVTAAGELLNQPLLLEYGRQRLVNVVRHFENTGGFNEYNSPSYTTIVLTESERLLAIIKDDQARAAAAKLRYYAWQTMAESFHPGSGQWAGPHSRLYNDLLQAGWAKVISDCTGAPVKAHPHAKEGGASSEVTYAPCPAEFTDRFRALPKDSVEVRRRFIRRDDDTQSTRGTTWLSNAACLGSVNYDTTWIQRRPLIAYWQTPADPAVVLKLHLLKNGNDFASGGIYTTQAGPRALSVVTFLTNKGDHHDHVDIPTNGTFTGVTNLSARFELAGDGVALKPVDARTFDLIGGPTAARIRVGPGVFGDSEVAIKPGQDAGRVWVDVVFYDGPAKSIRFADLPAAWVVFGLEIVNGAAATTAALSAPVDANGQVQAAWGDLQMAAPAKPHRHDF